MLKIQVSKDHYNFSDYMIVSRWYSIWNQLREISLLSPGKTLEVGPGAGVLKAMGALYAIDIETIDLDPNLNPDHVGSISDLPFEDASFDLVCAFQVLEHLEYKDALKALGELCRVASTSVLISLPDAQRVWRYKLYIPKRGEVTFMFARPFWRPAEHKFDGEHYWEINKKGYELKRVANDFSRVANIKKMWRNWENPYHRFFLLEK